MNANFPAYQPLVTNSMLSHPNPPSSPPRSLRFPHLELLPNDILQLALRRIFLTQSTLKVRNLQVKNSLGKKLLGKNFDDTLNFAKHIEGICQKASRMLNAIARLTPYMISLKNVSNKCFLQVTS